MWNGAAQFSQLLSHLDAIRGNGKEDNVCADDQCQQWENGQGLTGIPEQEQTDDDQRGVQVVGLVVEQVLDDAVVPLLDVLKVRKPSGP